MARLAETWLRLIRLYTFNTPVAKGKYRLFLTALSLVSERPRSLTTQVRDGRRFIVDLNTGMQETVFFLGEYEKYITQLASRLIGQGDVCIDAGANFGWYTTLMSLKTGPHGSVHAFEPVPTTFEELARNCDLLENRDNVTISNVALGDSEGEAEITLFRGEPTGHASLATKGEGEVFRCRLIKLDDYLIQKDIGAVDLIKVDIEGAEMSMLHGANRLFQQTVPPIILMEMALNQSKHFGYIPDDLIKFIGGKADFEFYKIDELEKRLIPILGFKPDDGGANVLCVPKNVSRLRRQVIEEYVC